MYLLLSFLSGLALFFLFPCFPFTSSVIFLMAAAWSIMKRKHLAIPVILIGFVYAFIRHAPPADFASLKGEDVIVRGSVQTVPHQLPSGRFLNEVTVDASSGHDTAGNSVEGLKGRDINVISTEALLTGCQYEMTVRFGKTVERLNPGKIGQDRPFTDLVDVKILKEEHVPGSILTWFQDRREELHEYLTADGAGDSGAFLSAITTGMRTTMSEELKDAFGATGLAHILSISGTHFGLFASLLFGLFRFAITLLPYRVLQRLTLYLSPSQVAAFASLPFVCCYLLISGASFPTVRSFIMIVIFLIGLLIGRKGYWLNSLLIAALLICLWDPSAILSISFQLSFLAVFIIGLFLGEGRMVTRPDRTLQKIVLLVRDSLLLSLSVSMGTALLVAYYFHYFSIISPVTNLVMTPIIGFILVSLSLFSGFVFLCTGHYPLQTFLFYATGKALSGVRFFASLPFAELKLPAFPVIAVLAFYSVFAFYAIYLLSGKDSTAETSFTARRIAVPAALCVSLVIYFTLLSLQKKDLTATFLDVGQGDASVISLPDGKTMIIDTGRTGREVESYLRFLGKRTVDVLIITHADSDHSGGAPSILRRFKVKEVWDNGLLTYQDSLLGNALHRSLNRGDEAVGKGFLIQVLHPYEGFYSSDGRASEGNNESLVVKVTGKRHSILYTADIAGEAEEDMLHLGDVLKSDVLKISHHGSRISTQEDFLKSVSPLIAVISVGRDNPFGHPHNDTLVRLEGVRVYRTDRDGAIKLTEGDAGFGVKIYRDFVLEEVKDPSGELRNLRRLFLRW